MKSNNNNKPCTCSAIQKCEMHRNSSMNQQHAGHKEESNCHSAMGKNCDNNCKCCNGNMHKHHNKDKK